jgi:pimeloyl-ACP methyl ester carboxylesterase
VSDSVDVSLTTPDGVRLCGTAAGSGPPFLLLHAGGERRSVWQPVSDVLAREGFSTIAYDQRGHGESGSAPGETFASYAADIGLMIASIDAAPVVVGSSLGGLAALLALEDARVQERVAGLVLVDVVPDPPPGPTRAWLTRSTGDLADNPLVDDILSRLPELRRAAAGLGVPTLLVRGGPDSPVTDADVERLATLVPQATVTTIETAGHLVARDEPVRLAEVLVAWARAAVRPGP